MKKLMMIALAACAAAMTGCQTRVQIERDEPTKILPKQEVREFNGTNILITTDYFVPPAHYCVTARSPLFAKESVARFAADVGDNGTWSINADGYSRDLSTNAVVMVKEMFAGGAQLAIAIGDAYTKIAGGGAQASTGLKTAKSVIEHRWDSPRSCGHRNDGWYARSPDSPSPSVWRAYRDPTRG